MILLAAVALAISLHAQIALCVKCVAGGGPPLHAAALPSDGTEPTYTVEPVTQRVPHCPAGRHLMQFDPAFYYNVAVDAPIHYGAAVVAPEHPDRWIEAEEDPSDTRTLAGPTYRCFKEPARASAPQPPAAPPPPETAAKYVGSLSEAPSTVSSQNVIFSSPAQPSEYPNSPFPCADGMKLQRYVVIPGNMYVHAEIEQFPSASWQDVGPGPHDGDYRCVPADEKAAR